MKDARHNHHQDQEMELDLFRWFKMSNNNRFHTLAQGCKFHLINNWDVQTPMNLLSLFKLITMLIRMWKKLLTLGIKLGEDHQSQLFKERSKQTGM